MSRLANIKIKTIIFLTLIAYAQYHEVGALNADNSQESNAPKQTIPGIPPGFEKILPQKWLHQLRELHESTMTFPEKRERFEEIMATVPSEILAKLPIAPIFNRLPEEWKMKIRTIYSNTSIPWISKHQKIGELIQTMPLELQKLLPQRPPWATELQGPASGFPPAPPPGFEKVLPKEIYADLVKIHKDTALSIKEKAEKIDQVMRSLPQEIIEKLPLPPGFDQLPEDKINEVKAIFSDKSLSYQEKDKKVAEFVTGLPAELRRKLRPPLPPTLNQLSPKAKEKIEAIFDDEKMSDQERQAKVSQLISSLPPEQKMIVQDAFGQQII